MKLGVHVGYWGLGLSAEDQLGLVQEAERLGYDSVWTAEAYGSDAATILGWLAQATSTIRLGSAIFQMPGRSAAMTAMTAATLDQLSGGRMILGIGSSGPQVAEGWHGQRFGRQLQRTREYVEVVRMALSRQRLEFKGETLELPLPDGPGKALKLTIAPVQERIPVFLAAIGPNNTTLAAEIADGWIPTLFSPEHVAEFRPLLEEGFARAGNGKGFDDFEIAPTVNVFVTDDVAAARDAMRPYVALYVGGMGSRDKNFYNALVQRYGFEDAAREVQDLYLEGKRDEAAAALPEELIDTVSLCGPPDVVRERLAVFRDAGVGTLMVSPMAWTFDDRLRQLQLVAELARLRILLGAFGDPGHAFPMLALRRGAGGARARRGAADLAALAGAGRGGRDDVLGRARVPGVPDPRGAAEAVCGRGAGGDRDASGGAVVRPRRGGVGHPDAGAGPGRGAGGRAGGDAGAAPVSAPAAGLPAVLDRGAAAADAARTGAVAGLRSAGGARARARATGVQRLPGAARARAAAVRAHRRVALAGAGGDGAAARVPARLAVVAAGGRAAAVGAAFLGRRPARGVGPRGARGAVDGAGSVRGAACVQLCEGWRTSRCG